MLGWSSNFEGTIRYSQGLCTSYMYLSTHIRYIVCESITIADRKNFIEPFFFCQRHVCACVGAIKHVHRTSKAKIKLGKGSTHDNFRYNTQVNHHFFLDFCTWAIPTASCPCNNIGQACDWKININITIIHRTGEVRVFKHLPELVWAFRILVYWSHPKSRLWK